MERAGSEGEWERSSASALAIHYIEQGTGTRGSKVGAQLGHGCHARPRVAPLTQFREQLAGDGVDMVGSRFGPSRVRIGLWA